jgi:hypothetical protein
MLFQWEEQRLWPGRPFPYTVRGGRLSERLMGHVSHAQKQVQASTRRVSYGLW